MGGEAGSEIDETDSSLEGVVTGQGDGALASGAEAWRIAAATY